MEPPREPTPQEMRRIGRLLEVGFLKPLLHGAQDPPPAAWGAQPFGIARERGGVLAALLFPHEAPRGVVLFGHPALPHGKGYFHRPGAAGLPRSDRVAFARSLGFAVVTFDYGGFGESDDPNAMYHHEWRDVLAWARRRFPGLPVAVWGVSMGGYFAHHALAHPDEPAIDAAIFESVAPDLLKYRGEGTSMARVAALVGKVVARDALRWFPAEAHALHVKADRVLYLSGARDRGIPIEDARRFVLHASPLARHHVVEDAGHLEAWKRGGDKVRRAAQETLVG